MEAPPKRIKLKFENPSLLAPKQLAQGAAQCWFPLKANLLSIADLAADIFHSFQLHNTCPHGIALLMENFALLPSQPISLLQEKDLLSVKEKIRKDLMDIKGIDMTICENLQTTSGGVFHEARNFELRALEEFEKESGGYRSEEEDTRLDLLVENHNGNDASEEEVNRLPRCNLKKKSKISKIEQRQSQRCFDKALNNVNGGGTEKKLVHGRRRKLDQDDFHSIEEAFVDGKNNALNRVVYTFEAEPFRRSRKGKLEEAAGNSETVKQMPVVQQNECTKASKKKRKRPLEEGDDHPKRNKNGGKIDTIDQEAEDDGNLSHEDMKVKRASQPPATKDIEDRVDTMGPASASRPSRSARRKKAKRQWLRKQAEERCQQAQEEHKANSLPFSSDEHAHRDSSSAKVKGEKALQPMLVAPGHIRFELSDSDGNIEDYRTPTPEVRLNGNIKSKKQGRSWGKDILGKDSKKNTREGHVALDAPNDITAQRATTFEEKITINFENLPSLNGLPQEGDVLAYRLVELTSNWTPEVSTYRVGRVNRFDKDSSIVKLDPSPDFPLKPKDNDVDVCSDERLDKQESFCSPYNEDGTLEIELSTLLDVRLVKKIERVDSRFISENSEPSKTVEENQQDLSQFTHHDTDKKTVTQGCQEYSCGEDTLSAVWQEITQELDRKRTELSQIDSSKIYMTDKKDVNERLKLVGCSSNEPICTSSEAKNVERENQRPTLAKIRKSYSSFLKSGALGPTMALLRAQHVL